MRYKLLVTTTAAALLGASALGTYALADQGQAGPCHSARHEWTSHHGHRGFEQQGMHKLMRKLDLSDQQREQVRDIMKKSRPQFQTLRTQMRDNQRRLMDINPDDPNYAAVVAQVSQANGQVMTQMIQARSQLRADMYKVLSPEQKQKLQAMQQKWQERMQKQMHEREQKHSNQG